MQTTLENATTQYLSSLSDWKEAESKWESQMSVQEKEKLDLIQKNNVLSIELDRSRSQLKEIEEISIESREKVEIFNTSVFISIASTTIDINETFIL